MNNRNKIALFHPDGGINNNPNLNAFLNILVENGFRIDVWSITGISDSKLLPSQQNINYYYVQSFSELDIIVSDYSFAIGVDLGIIYASRLSKILNIHYGFISYEIYFDDELVLRSDKENKKKAKESCRDVSFAIAQDKTRASLMRREYEIDKNKILYMPVAGNGLINFQPSKFLHDHLGLDHSTKILLHFGSILNWTMTDWAIENAGSLPEGWVIVIHNKNLKSDNLKNHPKVLRSNLPSLPLNQMHKLIQSATCSLGLYTPVKGSIYTQKNIEYMGLSSGKINISLQHGVPVVTNQRGEMADLIEKYNAGVVLEITNPLPFNCLNNLNEIKSINRNCHQLFNEHLDIRNFAGKILDVILKSVSNVNGSTVDSGYYTSNNEKLVYNFNKLTIKNKIFGIFQLFKNVLVSIVKKLSKTE